MYFVFFFRDVAKSYINELKRTEIPNGDALISHIGGNCSWRNFMEQWSRKSVFF